MLKDTKSDDTSDGLQTVPSRDGEVINAIIVQHDAVFGEITEGGPNYRDVGWLGTTALMIKTQIGLGVLSMPSVFDTFGIVPGNIVLVLIAVVTTWSDYMVGVIKATTRKFTASTTLGECSLVKLAQRYLGLPTAFVNFTFAAGSAMLSISIAFNALSEHAVCTAVFVAVAAVIGFVLSSIRTLGRISWLAWAGAICIIVAVFTVTIAVTQQDHPSLAKAVEGQTWKSDYKIINSPSFTDAISAISTLVFTYAGTPAFFSIVAEMREPGLYQRSLMICQVTVTVVYIIVGSIVYYYCVSYVASPALGSAGPLIKKVSYGIALPGLIVSLVLLAHLPAKHVFVRILRGSVHLASNSLIHWGTWLGSTFSVCLIAYLVASAIPVFSGLVSLIGALLGTFLAFQPYGAMWLYDNWAKGKSDKSIMWCCGVLWSIIMILSGTLFQVAGTYGSIVGIFDDYKKSGGSAAWSCADNSNSS